MEYEQAYTSYYKTISSLQLRKELYKSQLKVVVTSRKAREINQNKNHKNEGQQPNTRCNMAETFSNYKSLYKHGKPDSKPELTVDYTGSHLCSTTVNLEDKLTCKVKETEFNKK